MQGNRKQSKGSGRQAIVFVIFSAAFCLASIAAVAQQAPAPQNPGAQPPAEPPPTQQVQAEQQLQSLHIGVGHSLLVRTISGFTMPAIQTRRAETEIELKDGQSFGIAGLLDQRTTAQLSKVPGIGDIPILGELFKSRNINRSNTELIVLVTPTIVDPVVRPTQNPPVQVNMPIQNLDNGAFDKGLPSPAKNTGPSK